MRFRLRRDLSATMRSGFKHLAEDKALNVVLAGYPEGLTVKVLGFIHELQGI